MSNHFSAEAEHLMRKLEEAEAPVDSSDFSNGVQLIQARALLSISYEIAELKKAVWAK